MTKKEIDVFLPKIIHSQMKTMLLGHNMHVMTQSLKRVDGPHLPHGLSVVYTYTKVTYEKPDDHSSHYCQGQPCSCSSSSLLSPLSSVTLDTVLKY